MKNKRILLINPPFYKLMGSHFNGMSLGLCYIASVLKDHGFYVRIYNADNLDTDKYLSQSEILKNCDNYKYILNNINHPIWQEVMQTIVDFNPDVIGLTASTGTYKSVEIIAKLVKDYNTNIILIIGGVHPTILPDDVVKNKLFDFIVRKEGEYTFLEIVSGKPKKDILGISYMENNKIIHNIDRPPIKNLDDIPFPARDLYLNKLDNTEYGYIITGRGCPFECIFCASKKIWGRKVRYRSVENIIKEIEYIQRLYKTTLFRFTDDTFSLNLDRAKRICQSIIDKNINIKWSCDTRVDTVDEELIILMKKAGCIRVRLGIESGSNRILKLMKKGITIEQIHEAVFLIKKMGLDFTIYIMIGFPTETNEDVQKTINLSRELNPNYNSLSILAPYPGTEIYDDILKSGIVLPEEHWEYFFHQSKDMISRLNIDRKLIDEFLSLNNDDGKSRA